MSGRGTAILLVVLIAVMHFWFTGPLGAAWAKLWGPVQPLGGSSSGSSSGGSASPGAPFPTITGIFGP